MPTWLYSYTASTFVCVYVCGFIVCDIFVICLWVCVLCVCVHVCTVDMTPSTVACCAACGDMRSQLRAQLVDMGAAFEAVAMRTRSPAPVPVPKDETSAEELLSTWAQMFQGVCAMILSCEHDLSDDCKPAKVGTELSNSRHSSSKAPGLPDPGAQPRPCCLCEVLTVLRLPCFVLTVLY